jgi:signal transduction histidine kinase
MEQTQTPEALSQIRSEPELKRWQAFERLLDLLACDDLTPEVMRQALFQIAVLANAHGASLVSSVVFGSLEVNLSGGTPQTGIRAKWSTNIPLGRDQQGNISVWRWGEPFIEEEPYLRIAMKALSNAWQTSEKIKEEHAERVLAESLRKVAQVLNASLDMEEVLSRILDQLKLLIPYDSANVMLLEDGVLRMHAARGYQEFSGPVDMSGIRFVPEHTALMMEVLTGDQPVIQSDTTLLSDWLWVPCGKHIRSWMGVPLRVKGQAIGLFSIDKSIPNFFTSKHGEMAMALAAHAALALDNARMFARICEAQEQLRGLSARVMEAQEQERQSIAAELHDHAGQALLGLRAELQVLKRKLTDNHEALSQVETLDAIIMEISHDLRRLAHNLHPPLLTDLGLIPALEQHVEEFSRRFNLPVKFEVDKTDNDIRLPQTVELACYRVVQEALTNLAKYARAKMVRISLVITSGHVRLSVVDDGVGISRHNRQKGFGLVGMRERVMAVGGELQVWSQAGRGTRLEVEIPLQSSGQVNRNGS